MISGTVSTKRSFDELNLQPNFFLHTPLNPINPENISNKKITLGDSQHIYLSQPQFFWGQPVRINDHSSDSIEKNHRIIYNNFPHKRKYMADNFPMEIGAQSQNFQHNPGLDVFEVSKSSHETSFGENSITKNLDPQNSRISAGSSKPTKNQNVSNRVVIKSRGDYKIINRTFRTTKEIESAKTDIWKEVKVKEYKGLPLFDWEFIVTNKNPNTNCLAEPYSNVFYLSNDNLDLLRSSINTDIYYYKENADIMFSSKKRPAVLVALYKKHEDFFSSWKTDDSKKYFEALGKSWEADYDGRENKFQARVRCVKFATAYAIERIGFMTENNEFKIFADIEKAKEDAYEILKSYWKTLPLGKHFTGTWQLEKNEKPTNIPLLDHLRLPDLNGVTRASYGAETLCFALKHILPDNYHQSILTAKTNKNTLPKGLIQKLNNIALSVDHLKTKEKNLKLD
ncbi:hypothetical protein BY996DRAFT_6921699 [Phakopsora pachyrhizi]|nr:hypothetical protein BY996DRAFT_6921699 [Phakopsora pachyrhizi]